jgi:hypothetical protein
MRSFKEYLVEANNIKGKDVLDKIGMTRMKAMTKHPFYRQYVRDYAYLRDPVYTHSKGNLGHTVQAAADNHVMVRFDFHNYKVSNAHMFRWDGQTRTPSGSKMWIHKKSYHEGDY